MPCPSQNLLSSQGVALSPHPYVHSGTVKTDPNMEKLWRAYQKKYFYAANLSWYTVMNSVRALYEIT